MEIGIELFVPLIICILGIFIGIFLGTLPGFGGGSGLAIFFPIIISMSPFNAMILALSIYNGAIYGEGVTSIILGVPGGPGGAATVFDGFEMTKKGLGYEALTLQAVSSGVGAIISVILFMVFSPQLARVALKFGPPEFFVLAIFGLTIIASLDKGEIKKALFAGVFGMALTTIGADPLLGKNRMTFDILYLFEGIQLVPALLGFFCIAQMLSICRKQSIIEAAESDYLDKSKISFKSILKSMLYTFRFKSLLIRGSLIGTFIGALPAAGASIAAFVAYSQAKNSSKYPEKYGTGIPEGVIAPECANNANVGGSLIPTFTLGIPGSSAAAILMGIMMCLGLRPGPKLFLEQLPMIRHLSLYLILGSILIAFSGAFIARYLSKVSMVPINILVPIVIVTASIGAFAGRFAVFDIGIMLLLGVIGFFMHKYHYPVAATVLGFVLGPMAETNFLQSLSMSGNNYFTFFNRPVCIIIWMVILLSLLWPIISKKYSKIFISG